MGLPRPSPEHHDTDIGALRHALALAELAIGLSEPNPRVGCVITSPEGRVIGSGHTQAAGHAHAEVMALRDAQARGLDVRGATVYVTLEPCAHQGRTPPCCDALIDAGVARVVASVADPNPLVAGLGLARLRAAGISTELGLLADEATALNIGFFSRMQRGRPFLRMKIAASLDGRTALPNGVSQWITGTPARTDGHAWRKRAGAVLTGFGTVRDDDPRLDVRLVASTLQPLRVVIDSRLETPISARVLAAPGHVLIYAAVATDARPDLINAGAELVALPGPGGKVDLPGVLADLGRRGINELHVEAGEKLNGSWLREGLVDELLVYLAPKLLGPGLGLATLPTLSTLADLPTWRWVDCTPVGDDLRLRLRPV